MARALSMLLLMLTVAHAAGLSSLLEDEAECEASCPGDGPHGECPPGCQECACCFNPRVEPPAAPSQGAVDRCDEGRWPWSEASPLPPDPDEILHVPKLPLA